MKEWLGRVLDSDAFDAAKPESQNTASVAALKALHRSAPAQEARKGKPNRKSIS